MVKKFLAICLVIISGLFIFSSQSFAQTQGSNPGQTCDTSKDGQTCQYYYGSTLTSGTVCKGICLPLGGNCSQVTCAQAAANYGQTPINEVQQQIQAEKLGNQTPNLGSAAGGVARAVTSSVVLIILGDPNQTTLAGTNQATPVSSIQNVGNMIGMLYTPPATANDYVADVMHDAGIATPAYAQGLGFSSLAPVLETWKVFRTIAYFFYVIIFLVIGFMIMFRQKIGSQAVVTVQQALPKLLISLIAVTFSYAIAGLLIEVMYVAMFLILNVFVAGPLSGSKLNNTSLADFGSNSNIFSVAGLIINGTSLSNTQTTVGNMVTGALGITPNTPGQSVLSTITGLAAVVVFAIALLFSIFKLFFELLKTYITIIIMIVTAPISLMLGALPGNNAFGNWLKGLIFNLAVFPVVLIVIVMAYLLQTSIAANGGFLPPYIGGIGTAGSVAPILGLGVLLVIPDIVEKVKKMAPAGPFDDLANKAGAAIKKGYSGGELIPGLAASNTSKWIGGGLTGENILRKAGIGAAAGVGGAIVGVPRGLYREGSTGVVPGIGETAKDIAARGTRLTGDPTLKKWAEERTKQQQENKSKGGGGKPPI